MKLYNQIQKNVRLLVKQPHIGVRTNIKDIRSLIIGEFMIFYEVTKDQVVIHTIWDCRQNPDDLIIK